MWNPRWDDQRCWRNVRTVAGYVPRELGLHVTMRGNVVVQRRAVVEEQHGSLNRQCSTGTLGGHVAIFARSVAWWALPNYRRHLVFTKLASSLIDMRRSQDSASRSMTSGIEALSTATVVRISRGTFDTSQFAQIEQMSRQTSEYLMPAIRPLAGLVAYFAGVSPSGSMVNVSLWDSMEHADQMSRLPEMVVRARADFEPFGMSFIPIVNYPIGWRLP